MRFFLAAPFLIVSFVFAAAAGLCAGVAVLAGRIGKAVSGE
jgi:hypothetical protein